MGSTLHPLALALNSELDASTNAAKHLLSKKGKAIYFPSKGILGQSAEAKSTSINATIGTAFEEDGSPLRLPSVMTALQQPPAALLYAPSQGNPDLRARWKQKILEKNPSMAGKNLSLPVVTNALTHGLSIAGYLLLDEGDEVITTDLYWDNYELVFENAYGARLKLHNSFVNGGFDVGALRSALLADGSKKVVLLNFPNNPTGYTATQSEALAIRDAILDAAKAGKQVAVLLDDAYFGLVYADGVAKESLFPQLADLHENILAVKLDGPTKEDYVWGFRVGFISFAGKGLSEKALAALEAKAAGAVRGNISNASNPGQQVLLKAFADPDYAAQKAEKYAVLKARFDEIRAIFAAHPEYRESFEPMPFNSGYFMCVKPIGVDPETLRKLLIAEFSTGVIVLSGLIRIAFSAVPKSKLAQLFVNVDAAIRKLKSA